MRTFEMRLIKKELKDDNGHTFPVYYCKYLNSKGEIRYKDVTIKKELIPEIDKILVENSVDLIFSLSENKDDKDADIFQSWKSKQQKLQTTSQTLKTVLLFSLTKAKTFLLR